MHYRCCVPLQAAKDSLVLLEKKCISSGSARPCAKLQATRPPSPQAQVLTLAITGRGSFPSLKIVCQPASGWEKDATLDPAYMAEQALPASSLMTMPPDVRGGGVFKGASKALNDQSAVLPFSGSGRSMRGESDPYLGFVVVALLDGR